MYEIIVGEVMARSPYRERHIQAWPSAVSRPTTITSITTTSIITITTTDLTIIITITK